MDEETRTNLRLVATALNSMQQILVNTLPPAAKIKMSNDIGIMNDAVDALNREFKD